MVSQRSALSILRLQQIWGLCAHGHQVVNFFPFGGVFSICKNNSENVYQILLSGYFREELKQRTWERGLSWESPTRVLLSYSRKKTLSQTPAAISSRYYGWFLRESEGDIDLFQDKQLEAIPSFLYIKHFHRIPTKLSFPSPCLLVLLLWSICHLLES